MISDIIFTFTIFMIIYLSPRYIISDLPLNGDMIEIRWRQWEIRDMMGDFSAQLSRFFSNQEEHSAQRNW